MLGVWLKSGLLIPCIRLMWLSRREGRGKLGLSSVQYLRRDSRSQRVRGRTMAPSGLSGRRRWMLLPAPGERGWRKRRAGRVVRRLARGAGSSHQRNLASKQPPNRQQQVAACVRGPGHELTLHCLTSLPRGPSAGQGLRTRGRVCTEAWAGSAGGAHGHTATPCEPQGPLPLTGSAARVREGDRGGGRSLRFWRLVSDLGTTFSI